MHKRIWRVAEDTVETALADLSARESKQLCACCSASRRRWFAAPTVAAKVGVAAGEFGSRGTRRLNGRIAP